MAVKVKSAFVFGALLFAPLLVFAFSHPPSLRDERSAIRKDAYEQRRGLRQDVQEKRQDIRQEVQEKRQELRQGMQERTQEFRKDVKDRAEALRTEAQKKREELRLEFKEKREALRVEIEKQKEAFKEEARSRREELKKKLGERRAENIERFFLRMMNKFEAAIDRLGKFANRIEDRLDKAEDNGKEVSSLRSMLAQARDKIAALETALGDAKIRYGETVKDPDFKIAFRKVKEVVDGVAAKVKEAHKALVELVNSIKGLGGLDASTTSPAPAPAPTSIP